MRFKRPVNILSSFELTPALQRSSLVAAAAVGIAMLSLGSFPVAADEPDADETNAAASAANADTAEMSAKERRREARRRSREEPAPAAEAAATQAVDPNAPLVFVVAVEPEMECKRVAVVGSRVPKEVCTPVGQREAEEEQAQDFLRRTRERSTMGIPCGPPNPALPGPAASVC